MGRPLRQPLKNSFNVPVYFYSTFPIPVVAAVRNIVKVANHIIIDRLDLLLSHSGYENRCAICIATPFTGKLNYK